MFLVVSQKDPAPLYQQIMDQIKQAIACGDLRADEKLPSIREMAMELKISQITIKRAYADLEKEGYIYTRSGLGCFVSGVDLKRLKSKKLEEIRQELKALLKGCEMYGITLKEITDLIAELGKGD